MTDWENMTDMNLESKADNLWYKDAIFYELQTAGFR